MSDKLHVIEQGPGDGIHVVEVNGDQIHTLKSVGNGAGGGQHYDGPYEVTPKADRATVLETEGKLMDDNVTVLRVPYHVNSNQYGKTAYIAEEANNGN